MIGASGAWPLPHALTRRSLANGEQPCGNRGGNPLPVRRPGHKRGPSGMNFCGLTDSPASIVNEPEQCRCGSVTRVGYGLCLGCLLRSGLCPEEPQTESFDAALAEIDVRDSEWRLGNYQILEEIGRGGMGVIYRARQRHSRRIVALKRILSYHSDSRDTLVRFQREAEAVASLDHPNI